MRGALELQQKDAPGLIGRLRLDLPRLPLYQPPLQAGGAQVVGRPAVGDVLDLLYALGDVPAQRFNQKGLHETLLIGDAGDSPFDVAGGDHGDLTPSGRTGRRGGPASSLARRGLATR